MRRADTAPRTSWSMTGTTMSGCSRRSSDSIACQRPCATPDVPSRIRTGMREKLRIGRQILIRDREIDAPWPEPVLLQSPAAGDRAVGRPSIVQRRRELDMSWNRKGLSCGFDGTGQRNAWSITEPAQTHARAHWGALRDRFRPHMSHNSFQRVGTAHFW